MPFRDFIALFTLIFVVSTCAQAGQVTTDGPDLVINTKGGFSVKTADGDYSFKLGGRLMYDYDYTETNDVTTKDEFEIRRARLYASGSVKDWAYKMQFNIGNGVGGEPEDLYIRYKGFGKKANITIGHQNEPFGLELITSSKDISILERTAITEAYAQARNYGVQLSGKSGGMTYGVGVFQDDKADNDTAFTGRVTYSPVKTKDSVIHFGAGYSNRSSDVEIAGLEFAASKGPFHVQTEYMKSDEAGINSDGFYLQAGWIITGESRPYKDGIFKRVQASTDKGAFEIAIRYVDGDGKYKDEGLGTTDGTSYGIGLNYYVNGNVRLGLSYNDSEDNISGDTGTEIRGRVQFAF